MEIACESPEATGNEGYASDGLENPEVTTPLHTWKMEKDAKKPLAPSKSLEDFAAGVPSTKSVESACYSPSSSSSESLRRRPHGTSRLKPLCRAASDSPKKTGSRRDQPSCNGVGCRGDHPVARATRPIKNTNARRKRWTTSSSSEESVSSIRSTSLERQLLEKEKHLMETVPELLESMNESSQNLNDCESQLAQEEKKYESIVSSWQQLHQTLRHHYGSSLVDRARPYFEAAAEMQKISVAVQELAGEYGESVAAYEESKTRLRSMEQSLQYGAHDIRLDAQQQEHLSKATMLVLVAQQERDHLETCYAKVLDNFKLSQTQEYARRKEIGNTCISKARPCYNQIERYEQRLRVQQKVLDDLAKRTAIAKNSYEDALKSLEDVNNSVHAIREKFVYKARKRP